MLTKHIKQAGTILADFLLPPLCPVTGESVDQQGMIDPSYWASLNFINAPHCERCGNPFAFEASHLSCGHCIEHPPTYMNHRSALVYDDTSRELILKFKHGDQMHAAKCFTPWLRQAGEELLSRCDIMIPVPLHKMRLIKRRYNQANVMGHTLAKNYPNIQYTPDGLLRIKNTLPQGHKKAKNRQSNVKRAFTINENYSFEGKIILLIDDVYTTGSTLNECAKILYRAGAHEVNALTLAKVVKD